MQQNNQNKKWLKQENKIWLNGSNFVIKWGIILIEWRSKHLICFETKLTKNLINKKLFLNNSYALMDLDSSKGATSLICIIFSAIRHINFSAIRRQLFFNYPKKSIQLPRNKKIFWLSKKNRITAVRDKCLVRPRFFYLFLIQISLIQNGSYSIMTQFTKYRKFEIWFSRVDHKC